MAIEMCTSLNELKSSLQVLNPQDRVDGFLKNKKYKTTLFILYSICMGPKSSAIEQAVKGAVISAFNRFFSVFALNRGPRLFFDGIATDIFQTFIEGITYFKNELTPLRPVYHRDSVCGSGNKQWSVKMTYDPNDTPDERMFKQRMVRRCYIERTILDRVYEHVFQKPQDANHLRELRTMENMYLATWRDEYLSLDVRFDTNPRSDIFPTVLVLFYRDGNQTIQEEFTKTHSMVYARKIITATNVKTIGVYEKSQSFEREMAWKKVPIFGGGSMSLIPKRAWKCPRPCTPKHAKSF